MANRVLDWLLEPVNPSVRYFALRDLLGRPESSAEVRHARRAVMDQGLVPKILSKQQPGGYWGLPENFYGKSKYKGTVWTLILLASLGADGSDPRIRKACRFILDRSQDRASGGFAYRGSAQNGGYPSGVIPCLTGNMLWCLIRFGLRNDPRVQRGLDWVRQYLRFDDGHTRPPAVWPYKNYEMCWGKHTCLDAVVKPLKALAEIPKAKRTPEDRRVIGEAQEFLLRHHLYERSHHPGRPAKQKWLRLGYPLMWDTDALEMLDLLAGLGCRDSRLQDGLDLLLSKQDPQGRWPLEETYAGRYIVALEPKGQPSRWVTLKALTVIKRLGRNISGSGCCTS